MNGVLRYLDPKDRVFFKSVISHISTVLREITLTISDSIETGSLIETEIVTVVSLSTTEFAGDNTFKIIIIKKKKRFSGSGYLKRFWGYFSHIKATAHIFMCFLGFTSTGLGSKAFFQSTLSKRKYSVNLLRFGSTASRSRDLDCTT